MELPKFGNFGEKPHVMGKNTSISLGLYFEAFIEDRVAKGSYQNKSEVIRAALRLLEREENNLMLLSNAIRDGMNSGIAVDFDPQEHLKELKAKRQANG